MQTPEGPFVRVLIIREDDAYTAQMLEMDFAARGASEHDALRCLERVVMGQARLDKQYGRVPFTGVNPAPAHFWEEWRKLVLEEPTPASIPEAYVINARVQTSSYHLHW